MIGIQKTVDVLSGDGVAAPWGFQLDQETGLFPPVPVFSQLGPERARVPSFTGSLGCFPFVWTAWLKPWRMSIHQCHSAAVGTMGSRRGVTERLRTSDSTCCVSSDKLPALPESQCLPWTVMVMRVLREHSGTAGNLLLLPTPWCPTVQTPRSAGYSPRL